jgi:polar amino acid transport system substrate-binding protein
LASRVPGLWHGPGYEEKFVLRQQFMGIVTKPGQDDLPKNVNESVARSTADGELNKRYRKWLGVDLPAVQ